MMTRTEGGKPLYEQLRLALRDDILSGVYPPGAQMPSEIELGERYQVSRITVRRAVQELSEEGLLMRIQGKGTFVISSIQRLDLDSSCSFWQMLEERGRNVQVRLLREGCFDDPEAEKLLRINGGGISGFRRLLMDNGEPGVVEDLAFLPARLEISAEELQRLPFNRIFASGSEGGRIQREFRAVSVDSEIAALLQCEEGSATFLVKQVCFDRSGMPAVLSRSYFSGIRYSFFVEEHKLQLRHME